MEFDYFDWLKKHQTYPTLNGIWASIGSPSNEYGWKIHLSSIQYEAPLLLKIVVPILIRYGFPFKVARDSTILGMLNEGEFGATQIGKFITIYPPSPNDSFALAQELGGATLDFHGPVIVTDLYIKGAVYARYGSFNPKMSRDRLGNIVELDTSRPGRYTTPFVAPEGIYNPFSDFVPKEIINKSEITPKERGFLFIRPINVHPKGSVYLSLDLRKREDTSLIIIKEGRRYCMSDEFGRDMWDRLQHQANIHKILQGKVSIPSTSSIFEYHSNLYLPIEYINGEVFSERRPIPYGLLSSSSKKILISQLKQLVGAVDDFHGQGFIHRDLSPRNVMISTDGIIYLLDLELSHHINDKSSPPFGQGTPGFMSPQQAEGKAPSVVDDIYSLGSLILTVLTGLDPRRILFTQQEGLSDRIQSLSGAPLSICQLISRCVHNDPDIRPSLINIASSLDILLDVVSIEYQRTFTPNINKQHFYNENETIELALQWLINNSTRDDLHGLWLSPEIDSSKHEATLRLPHRYRLYRSASRGVAGVIYTISRLHRCGFVVEKASSQVNLATDWLLSHESTPDDQMPGLHFGEAGVAVAIAEAVKSGLIETGEWLLPYLKEALSGPIDWPDLSHGAAGQGIAALNCAYLLNIPYLASYSHRCVDYLLEQQHLDGSWAWPAGVEGMEGDLYTGFAHGVAGIVYFLAIYNQQFNSDKVKVAAEIGAQWLIDQAKYNSNKDSVWWTISNNNNESWRWWCHGSPGIALAFLALFKLTNKEQYAHIARLALRAHPLEVRYSNLSQCHGLSGLGEIFLEAYNILGDEEWLVRAKGIGLTLHSLAKKDHHGISWLVENPFYPTADLMIGCGGVVHFLTRLMLYKTHPLSIPLLI